jgi:hypothetical protein
MPVRSCAKGDHAVLGGHPGADRRVGSTSTANASERPGRSQMTRRWFRQRGRRRRARYQGETRRNRLVEISRSRIFTALTRRMKAFGAPVDGRRDAKAERANVGVRLFPRRMIHPATRGVTSFATISVRRPCATKGHRLASQSVLLPVTRRLRGEQKMLAALRRRALDALRTLRVN